MSQQSLTDFDNLSEASSTNSTAEPSDSEENTPTEEEQPCPLSEVDLPNVFAWESTTSSYKGATVVRPSTTDFVKLNDDIGVYPHTISYVVDGLNDLLSNTGSREIETPASYKSLRNEFTPLITGRTCSVTDGALGITRNSLETAIRVATGGGRYRTSDLSIYIGDPIGFVVKYDDDVFLFETKNMDNVTLEETPEVAVEPEPQDIHGFTIVEDAPLMQTALERFLTGVDAHCELNIDKYRELRGSSHVFETPDGTPVKINGTQLRRLDSPIASLDEIISEHTIEPDVGKPMTVEVPDVPTDPGEEPLLGGTVIGYRVGYRNKPGGIMSAGSKTSVTRIGDGARFYLYTYAVRFNEKETPSSDEPYYRASIDENDTLVAKYTIKAGSFQTTPAFRNRLSDSNES